jgi:hypothetical protein
VLYCLNREPQLTGEQTTPGRTADGPVKLVLKFLEKKWKEEYSSSKAQSNPLDSNHRYSECIYSSPQARCDAP